MNELHKTYIFVIIPRDQFDKRLVQLDTGFGIKNGRVTVSNKIVGYNLQKWLVKT
jgi:hypothetical protein